MKHKQFLTIKYQLREAYIWHHDFASFKVKNIGAGRSAVLGLYLIFYRLPMFLNHKGAVNKTHTNQITAIKTEYRRL
jgi:hypothetical protein